MSTSMHVDLRFFPNSLKRVAQENATRAAEKLNDLKGKTCRGAEFTGWFDWPKLHGFHVLTEIEKWKAKVSGAYDLVVVVGIGGSYLGTRAVADGLTHSFQSALAPKARVAPHIPLVFMGNTVSEGQFQDLLDLLEQHSPIINVVSKSGTTTEPAVAFRLLRPYMEKRFGKVEAARRIVCTTDPKSGALRKLANNEGYQTFEIPGDVGGRFSVLSAVGLVPLTLCGHDTHSLLQGAEDFFASVRSNTLDPDHPVFRYAAARLAAYEGGKRIEILSFNEPRLLFLAEWWKQLFGESEGKEHKGLFPAQLLFTTDLHSLGQYVQDGRRELLETFLTIKEKIPAWRRGKRLQVPAVEDDTDELRYLEGCNIDEINDAALTATALAHADGGVPCIELQCADLSEKTFGYLFAFFETACAVSALMLGVNPFDQPGVESYKKNLFALLGRKGYEEMKRALESRLH